MTESIRVIEALLSGYRPGADMLINCAGDHKPLPARVASGGQTGNIADRKYGR
jgi:hypothetical protein